MKKDRSKLGLSGQILSFVGSIIIITIGGLLIFVVLINAFSDTTLYNYRFYPFTGFDNIAYGTLYLIIGLIALWISISGQVYAHAKELFWGGALIALGLIAETIGGIIIIIGGLLLIIDFFY